MEKNKSNSVILGIAIFLALIIIGIIAAWQLGYINIADKANDTIKNKTAAATADKETDEGEEIVQVVEATELEKTAIKTYLDRIYMATAKNTIMPNFTNINNTSDDWCFTVAAINNFEAYSIVTKEKIMEVTKQLYGDAFTKIPEEIQGTNYNPDDETYEIMPFGMAYHEYGFEMGNVTKEGNNFTVELVEWNAEYDKNNDIWSVKDLNEKEIYKMKVESEIKEIEEYVNQNKGKFTLRKAVIEDVDGKLFIKSCSNI